MKATALMKSLLTSPSRFLSPLSLSPTLPLCLLSLSRSLESSFRCFCSFRLVSWHETKTFRKNRVVRVPKSCNFSSDIQHPGLVLASSLPIIVHIVKGGETLTSISKKYGVSFYAIVVANAVFEGQCLQIPLRFKEAPMVLKVINSHALDKFQRSFNIQVGLELKKIYSTVLSSCQYQFAKGSNLFPVLVPVVALLVIYMIMVLQHELHNRLIQKKASDKGSSPSKLRGSRWRAAIYDNAASDVTGVRSKEEHELPVESDHYVISNEEMSSAYADLEPAYQKFLSDCGMSKWGYWRGGSPE